MRCRSLVPTTLAIAKSMIRQISPHSRSVSARLLATPSGRCRNASPGRTADPRRTPNPGSLNRVWTAPCGATRCAKMSARRARFAASLSGLPGQLAPPGQIHCNAHVWLRGPPITLPLLSHGLVAQTGHGLQHFQFLRQSQGPSSGHVAVVQILRHQAGRLAKGVLGIEYLRQIDKTHTPGAALPANRRCERYRGGAMTAAGIEVDEINRNYTRSGGTHFNWRCVEVW